MSISVDFAPLEEFLCPETGNFLTGGCSGNTLPSPCLSASPQESGTHTLAELLRRNLHPVLVCPWGRPWDSKRDWWLDSQASNLQGPLSSASSGQVPKMAHTWASEQCLCRVFSLAHLPLPRATQSLEFGEIFGSGVFGYNCFPLIKLYLTSDLFLKGFRNHMVGVGLNAIVLVPPKEKHNTVKVGWQRKRLIGGCGS